MRFIACDAYYPKLDIVKSFGIPDMLIHFAWHGLPNNQGLFHFNENSPADYRFIGSVEILKLQET